MTWPQSPPWLLDLQARFGGLLRAPLSREGGTIHAELSAYDAVLVGAVQPTSTLSSAERLAIYHRQYWFRLFTALQGLFPLAARLSGYWHFNEWAARHLAERTPRGFDIEDIGEGFVQSLSALLQGQADVVVAADRRIPAAALLEAASVDAAFHQVLRAPHQERFVPTAADAPRLGSSHFVLSKSVALLQENWPLCQLRAELLDDRAHPEITLPAAWPTPRHWLLGRQGLTLGLVALEAREAELLDLLQLHPLEQALALLESSTPDAERAGLPERAQAWLARSVRLGIWSGLASARR